VRETVARLSQEFPEDDREGLVARWEHEAGALQLLDDLKERLIDGQLTNPKEIADLYGYSPTTARNWIDKGTKLGMWTEDEVSGWFAKGKRRRRDGKTEAPVKPDHSWKDEALDPDAF
jgi:hypothetical protein